MDKKEKSNWRLAEERRPDECRNESKLIFLRCEVFRVKLAVNRYIQYWDKRLELFGPDKAFLPILGLGPNGVMKDNQKELQFGYSRCPPPDTCQDPDGRAILFLDGTKLDAARNNPDITQEGLIRASWYHCHFALLSESAQRKGIVCVYKCMKMYGSISKSPLQSVSASLKGTLPIRVAAFHIMEPPHLISILLKFARTFIGKTMQKRIYVHNFGSREKNFESLSKYGIGRKQLPKELGGDFVFEKVELGNH